MRYGIELLAAGAAMLLLGGCGSFDSKSDGRGLDIGPPAAPPPKAGVSDYPVRIGSAYQVGEVTYVPADVTAYDEVGYASWYGAELQGRNTANGETFVSSAITGAHKTLPMPSYVEVTALDTGRTILVRVNDRGPFANDRLIDLSEGAATQLGISAQGLAAVRVRKVNPPEQERAMLRSGQSAPTRLDTPESLLKVLREKLGKQPRPAVTAVKSPPPSPPSGQAKSQPVPAPTSQDGRFVREGSSAPKPAPRPSPAPAANAAGYVVQVASFSSRANADALAKKIGARVAASGDGRLFRVRYGPFVSEAEAQHALADAKKRGYPQARLYRE